MTIPGIYDCLYAAIVLHFLRKFNGKILEPNALAGNPFVYTPGVTHQLDAIVTENGPHGTRTIVYSAILRLADNRDNADEVSWKKYLKERLDILNGKGPRKPVVCSYPNVKDVKFRIKPDTFYPGIIPPDLKTFRSKYGLRSFDDIYNIVTENMHK